MANLRLAQTQKSPMPITQLTQELAVSRSIPIVALVLLVARRERVGLITDCPTFLLDDWARLATDLLAQLGTPADIQHARKTAQRAIRIQQGYDPAAKDKAYQCLVEYVEGSHGVDRELTDEECVALNNGLVHAFAGYATYLDHVAGALPGGAR